MDWSAVFVVFLPALTYLFSIEALRAGSGMSLCTPFDGLSCFFTPPFVPFYQRPEYFQFPTADDPVDRPEYIRLPDTPKSSPAVLPVTPSTRSGYTVSMPDSWVHAGCEENEYPFTLEQILEIPGYDYKDTYPVCLPSRRDSYFSEMLDDVSASLDYRIKSVMPRFVTSSAFIVCLFMTMVASLVLCRHLFRWNNSARNEVHSLLWELSEQKKMANRIIEQVANFETLQQDISTRETLRDDLDRYVANHETYLGNLEEKDERLGVLQEEASTHDARYQKLLITSEKTNQENDEKIEYLSAQNTDLEKANDKQRRQRKAETSVLATQVGAEKAQKGSFHKALLAAQLDVGNLRSEKASLIEVHEEETLSLKGKLSDIKATMDERRVTETTSLRKQITSAQEAHEQAKDEFSRLIESARSANEDKARKLNSAQSKIRTLEVSLRRFQDTSEDLSEKVDHAREAKSKLEDDLKFLRNVHEKTNEELASRQEELDVAVAKVFTLEANRMAVSEANKAKVQALEHQLERQVEESEEQQKAARVEEHALKSRLESATIKQVRDQQKLRQTLRAEYENATETQLRTQAEAHHAELSAAKESAALQEEAAQSKVQAYDEEFNRRVAIHETELASLKAMAEAEVASVKAIAAEKEAELHSELESVLESVNSESKDSEENKKLLARLKEANTKLEGVRKHLRDNVKISRNALLDHLDPGRIQSPAASRSPSSSGPVRETSEKKEDIGTAVPQPHTMATVKEGATAERPLIIGDTASTEAKPSKTVSAGPAPATQPKSVVPEEPAAQAISIAPEKSASPSLLSPSSVGSSTTKPEGRTQGKPIPATAPTGQTSAQPTAEAATKVEKAKTAVPSAPPTSRTTQVSSAGPSKEDAKKQQTTPASIIASGPARPIATSGEDKPAPTTAPSRTPAPASVAPPSSLPVPSIKITTPDPKAKDPPAQAPSSSQSRSTDPPAQVASRPPATSAPKTPFAPATLFIPNVPAVTSHVPRAPSIVTPPTTVHESSGDVQMSGAEAATTETDEGMADAEGITDDEMDRDSLFDEPLDTQLQAELLGEDVQMEEASPKNIQEAPSQSPNISMDTPMGGAEQLSGQQAAVTHAEDLPDASSAPPDVRSTSTRAAPAAPQPGPIFDLSQIPKAAFGVGSAPQLQIPQISIDFASAPSTNIFPAPQAPPQRSHLDFGTAPSSNPLLAPPPLYDPHNRAARITPKNVVTGSTPSGSHTSVTGTLTNIAEDWDREAIQAFMAQGMSREEAEQHQKFATGQSFTLKLPDPVSPTVAQNIKETERSRTPESQENQPSRPTDPGSQPRASNLDSPSPQGPQDAQPIMPQESNEEGSPDSVPKWAPFERPMRTPKSRRGRGMASSDPAMAQWAVGSQFSNIDPALTDPSSNPFGYLDVARQTGEPIRIPRPVGMSSPISVPHDERAQTVIPGLQTQPEALTQPAPEALPQPEGDLQQPLEDDEWEEEWREEWTRAVRMEEEAMAAEEAARSVAPSDPPRRQNLDQAEDALYDDHSSVYRPLSAEDSGFLGQQVVTTPETASTAPQESLFDERTLAELSPEEVEQLMAEIDKTLGL